MAETQGRSSGTGNRRRTPTRLQSRAPASIQVSPASEFAAEWKVAIPLLSPLVLSPASPDPEDRTVETLKSPSSSSSSSSSSSREEPRQQERQTSEAERPTVKSWQHPAAPFFYEPTPFVPSFVPV